MCSLCLLACRPEGHNFPWLTERCSNMKYMDIFNITHQYFVGLMITQFHCNLKCRYIFFNVEGRSETNQKTYKLYTPNQKTATISAISTFYSVLSHESAGFYSLYFKYFAFLCCTSYLKKWSGLVHVT